MKIRLLREKAIKRFENGKFPKAIYRSLDKGKAWFFNGQPLIPKGIN